MPILGYGGSGQGGRRGINMRWVIGLVIAGIALVTYFSRTQINPVTGEKQRIALSVDQEKQLGLQAAPQMAAEMGGTLDPKTDRRAALVSEVGRRIVDNSDVRKSPYTGNFNFHLLADDKVINAFALPGGQVFITRALYDKFENEAQLAGVLGHEIGHVVGRHAAEHMAKGQLGSMLATAVGVAASDDQGGGRMAAVAAQMANQMAQLKFSRDDESESDALGIKYMTQAGYDPSEMLGVMKILAGAAKGGGARPDILATHPNPEKRHDDIAAQLKRDYPNGVPNHLTKGRPLDEAAAPKRDTW